MPNNANIVYEKPKLEESFWWRENVHLDKYDISLIGFSKGCVVLNQFLYEFHYLKTLTPDDQTSMDIVSRIKDMYWLDGGHSGGKNTWITSRPLLETLTRLGELNFASPEQNYSSEISAFEAKINLYCEKKIVCFDFNTCFKLYCL